MFLTDAGDASDAWDQWLAGLTEETCRVCLHKGIASSDYPYNGTLLPELGQPELVECFNKFGGNIQIKKPSGAEEGPEITTWKDSWDEHGGDWWSKAPLEESKTRFDDRWMFPNMAHVWKLKPHPYWPDYFLLVVYILAVIFLLMLSFTGAPLGLVSIFSCLLCTGWVPYWGTRIAQVYAWRVDSDGCALSFFDSDQWSSVNFWMMMFFYIHLIWGFQGKSRSEGESHDEGIHAVFLCCNFIFGILAWILCLVFLSQLMSDNPWVEDNLQNWQTFFIVVGLDFVVLLPIAIMEKKCCRREDGPVVSGGPAPNVIPA